MAYLEDDMAYSPGPKEVVNFKILLAYSYATVSEGYLSHLVLGNKGNQVLSVTRSVT